MAARVLIAVLLITLASLPVVADGPAIEWQVFNSQNDLTKDWFLQLFEDVNGNIWLATQGAASAFDGTKWTNFGTKDGLVPKMIMEHFADSHGHVWFINEVGKISKFDGQKLVGGSKISSRFMLEDSERKIWIASGANSGKVEGLLRFDTPDQFPDEYVKFTKKQNDLAGKLATVIFEDSRNTLWVGTTEGVSKYDGNRWTTYNKSNGCTSKTITAIVEDSNGNVWFGSYGGLFRFDGESWKRFTEYEGTLPSDDVQFLEADTAGNVWVGFGGHANWGGIGEAFSDPGYRSGVLKFDGDVWMAFRAEGDSPPVKIIQMELDSKGNIWCDSYSSGIFMYDGRKWTRFSKETGFLANHFYDFEEDSLGNIWLATGSGLHVFDGQDWTNYTVGNGLFAGNVFRVIEDSRGHIWITTGKGVGRYQP